MKIGWCVFEISRKQTHRQTFTPTHTLVVETPLSGVNKSKKLKRRRRSKALQWRNVIRYHKWYTDCSTALVCMHGYLLYLVSFIHPEKRFHLNCTKPTFLLGETRKPLGLSISTARYHNNASSDFHKLGIGFIW